MYGRSRFPRAALVLVALVLGACTTLQRAELPFEPALPPSEAPFWQVVTAYETDDWFSLLNAGEEALDWRLRAIDSARVSIDMETFLWKPDSSGYQVLAHLFAAADRGVRVRMMLDDSFTMHEDLMLHAIDEHPNMEVRIYNPFRHRSDNVVLRQLFNLGEFTRTNHRMHNKALIVDGQAAIIGGRNLADEYFGRHAEMNFRDMEVITVGTSVPLVIEHFDRFWNSGWAFPVGDIVAADTGAPGLGDIRQRLEDSAQPVPEPITEQLLAEWNALAGRAYPGFAEFFFDYPPGPDPDEPQEQHDPLAFELYRVLQAARQEIILVTAYLVPTPELEAYVEAAEARGVHVRILTNSLRSNNHLAAHAAYRGHVERLVDHGADLHEVRAQAVDRHRYMRLPVDEKELGLHAKLLLVDDDVAFIGSANLDPRSLNINTEVGLIIRSRELNAALRERIEIDFHPRNAWAVKRGESGNLEWIGHDQVLQHQPSDSAIQQLEDWFIGLLPIDGQM
jgi:putative cardiolipin synthase